MPETPDEAAKHERADDIAAALRAKYAPTMPTGPTLDAYRIAGYTHGLIGSSPECLVIAPRYDSGIRWADPNNPTPEDVLWGGGVRAGLPWDGTLYRDASRYPAGGAYFWSSYFKPGSGSGDKNGFWMNFGKGWSRLHNDDPAQILAGASQRLFWNTSAGQWVLRIEATQYVTHAVIPVWVGVKPQGGASGTDPVGEYTRVAGCDPLAMLTVEAV